MNHIALAIFAVNSLLMTAGTDTGEMVRLRIELNSEEGLDKADVIRKVAKLEAMERAWNRRQLQFARERQLNTKHQPEARAHGEGIIGPVRIKIIGSHKAGGGSDSYKVDPLSAEQIRRIRELQQQIKSRRRTRGGGQWPTSR